VSGIATTSSVLPPHDAVGRRWPRARLPAVEIDRGEHLHQLAQRRVLTAWLNLISEVTSQHRPSEMIVEINVYGFMCHTSQANGPDLLQL
jgi:hypothetical protein